MATLFKPNDIHKQIISLFIENNLSFEEAIDVLQDTKVALGKIKIQSLNFVQEDSQQ